MKKILFTLLILLFTNSVFGAINISGLIKDRISQKGLPDANIYIKGSYIGTVSNEKGYYAINIAEVPSMLVVSYIGYQTRQIEITESKNYKLEIELEPAILHLESITVTADKEDPAIIIMRKVIENKKKWKKKLKSYKAKAYTRNLVENDSSIVSILESVSALFWDFNKGAREQFIAKKKSKQMGYLAEMNAGSKNIFNFYDDNIMLLNHKYVGPTHPEAFNYYDFKLIGELVLNNKIVYEIQVKPKSKLQPLFKGVISILDKDFALVKVDLKNTGNIVFSTMIKYFNGHYKQQFNNFGQEFWLPINSNVEEEFMVDMGTLAFPKVKLKKISRISNYEINIDVTSQMNRIDTIKISPEQRDAISKNKKAFINFTKVPLTNDELEIINNPDTTLTLVKTFRPTGIMAPMVINREQEIEKSLKTNNNYTMVDVNRKIGFGGWYNRVEELYGELKLSYRFRKKFNINFSPGYSTGLKRFSFNSSIKYFMNKNDDSKYLMFEYNNKTDSRYSSAHYSKFLTSALLLVGKNDYFDYFQNEKIAAGIKYGIKPIKSTITVQFGSEKNSSLKKQSNCNFLNKKFSQRVNPAINDGKINSLRFKYTYEGSYGALKIEQMTGISSTNKFEFTVEHSSANLFNSDFDFTKYQVNFDFTLNTFLRRRPDGNYFRIRVESSFFSGDLPLQRFEIIDGSILSYAPFGIFKTLFKGPLEGEKKVAAFWEHNFKSVPFELLGLKYFKKQKYEFIIQGASGRTWIEKDRFKKLKQTYKPVYLDDYHHELGVAVRLKYNFIGMRLDASRNFNTGNIYLGLSFNLIAMSF